jgi:hypothetical protein
LASPFAPSLEPLVTQVAAAAVDPLEIAASLETCGLSNSVVRAHFGHKDVFSLAEQLYVQTCFQGTPSSHQTALSGTAGLGRGVVFAVPTLLFASTALALRTWLSWWAVPLALISAWGPSRFLATRFMCRTWGQPSGRPAAWGAATALASGVPNGLLVAVFIVLEPVNGVHGRPGVAGFPVVLSLGALEWQLRSLRAGTCRALRSSYTLAGFARRAQARLVRSTLFYVLALLSLTCLARVLAGAQGVHVPLALVTAGTLLAVAFFLALVVASCGRVDLVLGGWSAGLAVYCAWGLLAKVAHTGWTLRCTDVAFCIATAVPVAVLAVAARLLVTDPVCHA